jgi:hypothetical protein
MKVSTIAAIIAAVTGSAAAVVTCKAPSVPSGSPGAAPQDAMASDASRPSSAVRRLALAADGGAGPTYLNVPEAWTRTTATQLQQFFHLSEGSEVFPYGGLLAIYSDDATPFFVAPQPTFGLLAEPKDTTCDPSQQPWCNSYGVPVGMTVAITRDTQLLDMKMFGFNCAACHVGELQAGGTTYRVLGGPNMFDAIGFVVGLKNAVGYTKGSVANILAFLARWAAEDDNSSDSAIGGTDKQFLAFVKAAAPSVIAARSPIGQALAKALQQTFTQVSSESFPPRGPGLHVVGVPASPAAKPTLKPPLIPPGSRPDVPPGKTAYTMPPTRPTMSSVALHAKTELATLNQTFGAALAKTPLDGDAQALSPFDAALAKIQPADRLLVLDSFFIDFWEALALLKERFSALSALGAGGQVGVENTTPGPGRVDAFMTARNILFPDSPAPATSPVDIPRIWKLLNIPWYHWDGNTNSLIERNVGQAVVIGAVIDPKNYQSTLLIENIQTLEKLAGDIPTPPWPSEIDAGAGDGGVKARGAELFARNCGHCHGPGNDAGTSIPNVKTDELRIHNFSLPMDGGGQFNLALKAKLDAIMQQAYAYADAAADAQENPDSTVIRAPQEYANRSLEGVWATAPYLHNGSVASLADLLEPPSARPSLVTVGGRVYDTDRVGYTAAQGAFSRDGGAKGDSMGGHDYGTDAGAYDKKALLEFLKSL